MPTGQTGLHDVAVASNERVAEKLFRIVLSAPELASGLRAGQFLEVAVPGDASQILRVPLSFSRSDAKAGSVEIVYALVGDATRRLSRMVPGDAATVVGPCGNPWRMRPGQLRAALVSGGVGVTPIVACAGMLADAGVPFDAVVGATDASRLWGADELRSLGASEVVLTTDDGSAGLRGLTTDGLRALLAGRAYDEVYACGPEPMMAAVARLAHEAHVGCQVSMERMMSCGFGACGTCNVALASGGYASACKDGTVFDAEEVAW